MEIAAGDDVPGFEGAESAASLPDKRH